MVGRGSRQLRAFSAWAVLVALIPAGVVGAPQEAAAAEREPDGSIVMATAKNTIAGLYIAAPDCETTPETNPDFNAQCLEQLTDNVADSDPAWDPTGQLVAFEREGNIYVAHVANGTIQQLTETGLDSKPAWSPDGRRIAFTRVTTITDGDDQCIAGNVDRIWTTGRDGTSAQMIPGPTFDTEGLAIHRDDPTWSPDGSQIAYGRVPRANDCGPIVTGNVPIDHFFDLVQPIDTEKWVYVSSSDSHSGESPIVFPDIDPAECVFDGGLVRICPGETTFAPDWAPDGSKIVVSTEDLDGLDGSDGVWTVPPPGMAGTSILIRNFHSNSLAWSTEGDFIATDGVFLYAPDGTDFDRNPPGGSGPDVQCVPDNCLYGALTIFKTVDTLASNGAPESAVFNYLGDISGSIMFDSISDGTQETGSLFGAATQSDVSVQEAASEWSVDSITCDDPQAVIDVNSRSVTLSLERGQFAECTFTSIWESGDPDDPDDPDDPAAACGTDPETFNGAIYVEQWDANIVGTPENLFTFDVLISYCWNGTVSAVRSADIVGFSDSGFLEGVLDALGFEPAYLPEYDVVAISADGSFVDASTRFAMCVNLVDILDKFGIKDVATKYVVKKGFQNKIRRVGSPDELRGLLENAFESWTNNVDKIDNGFKKTILGGLSDEVEDIVERILDDLKEDFLEESLASIPVADIEGWSAQQITNAVVDALLNAVDGYTTVCDSDLQVLWEPEFSFGVTPTGQTTINIGGYLNPLLSVEESDSGG